MALAHHQCGRVCVGPLLAQCQRYNTRLVQSGFMVDTCIAVAPILQGNGGVMMTNSAKFAYYGPGNTGYKSVFGSLVDCVESAIAGEIIRDDRLWQP